MRGELDDLTRLLVAARGGDGVAFEAFVRASYGEVHRFCLHMVGAAAAEDALQETYLAAWRAAAGFRGESSARTWLFVLARRAAERVGRRGRRLAELDGHLCPPQPPPGPELGLEAAQLLAGLDPERRAALVLTGVIGLSYAEAAQVCECPVGTIRSRVARAREQLLAERAATARLASGSAG